MPQFYELITSNSLQNLNARISQMLVQGWSLHGSPVIYVVNSTPFYAQVVVKG